jgi:hypothetical protein
MSTITIPVRCAKASYTFDDTPFVREHIANRHWAYAHMGETFFGFEDGNDPWVTSFEDIFLGERKKRLKLAFLNGDRTDFRATNLQEVSNGRLYLGDVRADGMVFWEYSKLVPGNQYWITARRFRELQSRMIAPGWAVRRGDVNADGKICTSVSTLGKPTWTSLASWDKTQAKKKSPQIPLANAQPIR